MNEVLVLAGGLAHPEGPALLPDGRVVFVETYRGVLSAWGPSQGLHLYAQLGGGPNACVVGEDGVYVAQNGGTAGPWRCNVPVAPSIQKVTWEGRVETVAASVAGEPLWAPNDLAFGADGRLYFSDPGHFDPERPAEGRVCVVNPDGTTELVRETGPVYPNGVAAEAGGAIVWDESYTRTVRRLRGDGSIELLARLPEDRVPDGLKPDAEGRLLITGGGCGGIDVLAGNGEALGFVKTGGEALNCVFDGQDLYVTDFGSLAPSPENGYAPAGGRLLKLRMEVPGEKPFQGTIG